ncbi:hypothetical protein [Alphaproteobacteria bacterium endosymbiont of Tiliacea citrago]|uniref:hypothetical protein n=1 Tax=Alphaproteobacteria bacterium endosymbiont of Tiliacea citrago TaxID=3077944 RepID=UPI00313EFAC7
MIKIKKAKTRLPNKEDRKFSSSTYVDEETQKIIVEFDALIKKLAKVFKPQEKNSQPNTQFFYEDQQQNFRSTYTKKEEFSEYYRCDNGEYVFAYYVDKFFLLNKKINTYLSYDDYLNNVYTLKKDRFGLFLLNYYYGSLRVTLRKEGWGLLGVVKLKNKEIFLLPDYFNTQRIEVLEKIGRLKSNNLEIYISIRSKFSLYEFYYFEAASCYCRSIYDIQDAKDFLNRINLTEEALKNKKIIDILNYQNSQDRGDVPYNYYENSHQTNSSNRRGEPYYANYNQRKPCFYKAQSMENDDFEDYKKEESSFKSQDDKPKNNLFLLAGLFFSFTFIVGFLCFLFSDLKETSVNL